MRELRVCGEVVGDFRGEEAFFSQKAVGALNKAADGGGIVEAVGMMVAVRLDDLCDFPACGPDFSEEGFAVFFVRNASVGGAADKEGWNARSCQFLGAVQGVAVKLFVILFGDAVQGLAFFPAGGVSRAAVFSARPGTKVEDGGIQIEHGHVSGIFQGEVAGVKSAAAESEESGLCAESVGVDGFVEKFLHHRHRYGAPVQVADPMVGQMESHVQQGPFRKVERLEKFGFPNPWISRKGVLGANNDAVSSVDLKFFFFISFERHLGTSVNVFF